MTTGIPERASRRQVLSAAAALATSTWLGGALAQQYPVQTLRIVVPYPAGGPVDFAGRLLARELGAALNVTAVVDNKPGANGVIGSQLVAQSAPDGATLLLGETGPISVSPVVLRKPPYDPLVDFVPIIKVVVLDGVLVTRPDLPVTDLQGLVALLKSQPGKISYGSAGEASSNHLSTELFQQVTGTKMLHVPYKGAAPLVTDLLAGQIDVCILPRVAAEPHIKAGKLRAIAVASPSRIAAFAGLQTIAETYPRFELTSWVGLLAPKGTPKPIVDQLHAATRRILETPRVSSSLREAGFTALEAQSPDDFRGSIRRDLEHYGQLVRSLGIALD